MREPENWLQPQVFLELSLISLHLKCFSPAGEAFVIDLGMQRSVSGGFGHDGVMVTDSRSSADTPLVVWNVPNPPSPHSCPNWLC